MQHFEAYQQALEEGEKVALTYIKLILFGPPLSGKTSTRKRLLEEIKNLKEIKDQTASSGAAESTEALLKREESGEISGEKADENSGEESSDVLNKGVTSTPAAIFKPDKENEQWKWETVKCSKTSEPSEHEQSQDKWEGDLRYIAKICFNIITNNSKGEDKEKQKQPTANQTEATESNTGQMADSSSDVTDPTDETAKDDMKSGATSLHESEEVEKAIRSLESILITHNSAEFQRLIENLIMVNMIDVGGQPAFLEMLPTLTIGSALYLLFFRMDHDLQKVRGATFRAHKGSDAQTLDTEYSIEDVLCQGLSSVASFGCTQPSDISLLNAKPEDAQKSVSHALLVGTYKDVPGASNCVSKANELWVKLSTIKKNLLLPAGEGNNERFFQVANMTGEDDIDEMRKKISRYLSKKYTGWNVPATWLIFRIILQLMDKPVVTIPECEIVAKKLNMLSSMKEALWFLHHQIGCLMYYPKIASLKDVVICNPQEIFNMISEVIIGRFNYEDMEEEDSVKCFKEKGEFTITQIDPFSDGSREGHYLNIKQLVDLMTYHCVIAKIGTERYTMPSVLKCASKEDIEDSLTKGSAYPLKIKFSCNYVPIGVFCGAASLLIAHCEENGWTLPDNYKLYKNKVSFSVDNAYRVDFVAQPLYLGVQVTLEEYATKDRKPLNVICCNVKKTVDSALQEFISQVKYSDPTLSPASDKPPYEHAFDCKCKKSSHLMKVCDGPEKRKGKCPNGPLIDLEDKHLMWFGQVCSLVLQVNTVLTPLYILQKTRNTAMSWMLILTCIAFVLIAALVKIPYSLGKFLCHIHILLGNNWCTFIVV